jgi:hypothetical protein
MRGFKSFTLCQINNYNDQGKDDEISRACSTHGIEEECINNFGGNARRKDHWEDLDIGGRILDK